MLIRPRHDESHRIVVAIPVRNEQDYIGPCLAALARQSVPPSDILLLLNNCTDQSLNICQRWQADLPSLRIIERHLDGHLSTAGEARRLALEMALELAGDGLLLTTDADGMVPHDWVADNLREIAQGADAVCGKAAMTPEDAQSLPPHLHADHLREEICLAALDALENAINPAPHDPWPRHQQQSGASIAVTAAALRRAGGPPHVSHGEDRALIAKLRATDARIRHADISVTVSGRLQGRAAGGMAETISRRLHTPDVWADERIEPAIDFYRRAIAKSCFMALRRTGGCVQALGHDLLVGIPAISWAQRQMFGGAAWDYIQRISPVLRRRRVAVEDLPRETRQAVSLLNQLARDGADEHLSGIQQAAD
jgi:glycosyltransferase involved in cell wall biosynthesis